MNSPHVRRIWPSLAAVLMLPVLSIVVATTGATMCTLADLVLGQSLSWQAIDAWVKMNGGSARAFYAMLVPIHLTTLALALAGGALSGEPFVRRLGLVHPSVGVGALSLFLLATLGVQFLGIGVANLLFDSTCEQFDNVTRLFRDTQGLNALGVGLLATVGAGTMQELFFRGYVLRGLLRRWGPLAAISVTAAAFALYHGSAYYMILSFFPAVWLGLLSWRTGSVIPAVVCHVFINAAFMALLRLGRVDPMKSLCDPGGLMMWIGLLGLAALLASVRALRSVPEPIDRQSPE